MDHVSETWGKTCFNAVWHFQLITLTGTSFQHACAFDCWLCTRFTTNEVYRKGNLRARADFRRIFSDRKIMANLFQCAGLLSLRFQLLSHLWNCENIPPPSIQVSREKRARDMNVTFRETISFELPGKASAWREKSAMTLLRLGRTMREWKEASEDLLR